jgi:hypothetical protein
VLTDTGRPESLRVNEGDGRNSTPRHESENKHSLGTVSLLKDPAAYRNTGTMTVFFDNP